LPPSHDLCIVGAGGFVGRCLVATCQARGLRVLRVTSSIFATGEPDTIIWNYRTAPPLALANAAIVVNCAKAPEWAGTRAVLQHLAAVMSPSQRYVHLSSNAVHARARGIWALLIKGDDYIRTKRLELRWVQRLWRDRPVMVVYPGVLLGEGGGWDQFMRKLATADRIHGHEPCDARSESIDITAFCERLADQLTAQGSLPNDLSIPDPKEPTPTWQNLLRRHASPNASWVTGERPYLFFPHRIKNLVMTLLTLRVVPDALALRAFGILRGKANAQSIAEARAADRVPDLYIDGMTKFYVSQAPKA
jgi:hypothetical protein